MKCAQRWSHLPLRRIAKIVARTGVFDYRGAAFDDRHHDCTYMCGQRANACGFTVRGNEALGLHRSGHGNRTSLKRMKFKLPSATSEPFATSARIR